MIVENSAVKLILLGMMVIVRRDENVHGMCRVTCSMNEFAVNPSLILFLIFLAF